MKIKISLISVILFLGLAFLSAAGEKPVETKTEPATIAAAAEPVAAETTDIKSDFFSDFPAETVNKEKILYDKQLYLIDIWATWCPPCRQTIPELFQLQAKYKNKSFSVVGISVDTSEQKVIDFLKEMPLNYPVAMANEETLKKFPQIRGIPTMLLMDQSGELIKVYVGYTKKEVIEKDINFYFEKRYF